MNGLVRAVPIYTFLRYCNSSDLPKKILDCGAGGNCPPLSLFYENGFDTYGIEVSDREIESANMYSKENEMDLNIAKGDMRKLPFKEEAFSFVYSFNSIFHMNKTDTLKSMDEMKRVLKKEGLCFVNFLSVDDCGYGQGEAIGDGEFLQDEDNGKVIHSYYRYDEPDRYFSGFTILRKEKRTIELNQDGNQYVLSYIDYIAKKK